MEVKVAEVEFEEPELDAEFVVVDIGNDDEGKERREGETAVVERGQRRRRHQTANRERWESF